MPRHTEVEWSMYSMMSLMRGISFSGQICIICTRPTQTCRLTPLDVSLAMLNSPCVTTGRYQRDREMIQ